MTYRMLGLLAAFFLCSSSGAAQEAAPPDYNSQVAPIFQKYCVGCHAAGEPEGGLILEGHEQLLAGGKNGAAIVPGDSKASRLILMLEGQAKPAMPPPDNEAPQPEEIALLKAWVNAGAKGPSGAPLDPTLLVTPQVELLAAPRSPIHDLAYSPDGTLIALAGANQARLQRTATQATLYELAGHRGHVNGIAFSTDGARLVTASGEAGLFGEAKLWSAADGALQWTFTGHNDSLYAAVLSPDGAVLATAGYDEQIKLWDVATGAEIRSLAGHNGAIFGLAFRPDGKILASVSGDRTLKLWDVASGARLDTLGQSLKELYSVAFSPDGSQVAAAGVDSRIRVWNVSPSAAEGTNPLVHVRFAHQGPVLKIVYSRDGKLMASASEDRTIKLWDAEAMKERRLLEAQSDWTSAMAFSPDGKTLLVGRMDGAIARYDTTDGRLLTGEPPAMGAVDRPATSVGKRGVTPLRGFRGLAALLAMGYLESPPAAPAAKPELTGLSYRGLQRGVATQLKLVGNNLLAVTEVRFNDPRLTAIIQPEEPDLPGEITIEVLAATELPRGRYELSVSTAAGTSGVLPLHVDDIPQLVETEPNGTLSAANAASTPLACWGVLDVQGDVDQFRFDAVAGQTVVLDLAGVAIGSKINAVVTILDQQGRVVAAGNDFDGLSDPLLAFAVPADGRYIASVSDQSLTASAEHFYRLSIGTFAQVTGCYPLSIPAGQETIVRLTGYNLPSDASVTVTGPAGEIPIPIDPGKFRARRELKVIASSLTEALEVEPNDDPSQGTPIDAPGVAGGRIWPGERALPDAASSTADVDLFRFEASTGQTWIIETEAGRRASPVDTKIEVLDSAGKPVERLLLQAVRDSYVEFRGIDSNQADIRVTNWEEMGLNQFLYMQGEVSKLFRMPQGPDSGFKLYSMGAQRQCFFDTSATAHALDEPCYIVEPHPPGTQLVPTGLPIFPVNYVNDDDGERKLGSDSKLAFTAPATGAYLIRVSDVRGLSGDRFAYRLIVREPKPDFNVTLAGANPTVNAGSGKDLTLSVDRLDGFDGEIRVDVEGLPPGFSVSSPIVIQAGHVQAKAAVVAALDAPQPTDANATSTQITATADIAGATVTKTVNSLGKIALAEKAKLLVRLEPDPSVGGAASAGEIVIAPGTQTPALLKIERNGFEDLINFDVDNLPHGIIVDDIGLNGVLIPAGMTERRIFLNAAAWVPETSRSIHAVAKVEGNQTSPPVVLHVRRPAAVADR